MSLVDERGRVAGRVNLIDGVVAAVIVLMIPLAVGAYLLFRNPRPKLTNIAPATLYQGPNLRIGIGGKNLRPFMRVSFNTTQGLTFMIGSTEHAAVDLPDLPPGVYDVVLFDYMQEVDRLPKALTILPAAPQPTVMMEVGGFFYYGGAMEPITVGQKFPPNGPANVEVLSVGTPVPADLRIRAGDVVLGVPAAGQVRIPATLRVACYVTPGADGALRCMFQGPQQPILVAADTTLTLQGPKGWINFQISDVHVVSDPAVSRSRVAFVVTPVIVEKMKVGDQDSSPKVNARNHSARIVALENARGAGDDMTVVATLDVPVDQVVNGWSYKQAPFKIGAPFSFETPEYIVEGVVRDMSRPRAAPSSETSR
jgi:hypothetical protein